MIFEYEIKTESKTIENPTLVIILENLNEFNPHIKSFFILTNDSGDFVQCAGARLRLTIEYKRLQSELSVLGLNKENKYRISVNYSGGALSIQRNEVLTIKDAIKVFESFYKSGEIPESYILRQVV